ncbi:MAG: SGNH/GDSL hydrolase family protein [Proteobacteria bacterium]|nr:SGNH/GDSL hydrolase family protein [Pseudomonadota bacterium]
MKLTRTTRTGAALLAAITLASLAACGGGNDTPAAAQAQAPAAPSAPADTRLKVDAITVFGDSLSDVGTYAVTTGDPANHGKFTVNPGAIWVENIAAYYGLALTPNRSLTMDKDASYGATTAVGTASVLGGNGYAEGGARVAALPSESGVGNNQLVAPVATQIDHYFATHDKVGAKELVVIDGGGNDTYAQFSAVCWGTDDNQLGSGKTTIAIATAQIESAARAQVANIARLVGHGAPLVLVASASDWSGNPFGQYYLSAAYQATGCYTPVTATQIGEWTARFNQILHDGVAGLAGVVYLDTGNAFADVLANPQKYGLVNTQAPACNNTTPTSSASYCTASTLVAPDAAQTYFWSDAFHPTPRGHKILSDAAISLLDQTARPGAPN